MKSRYWLAAILLLVAVSGASLWFYPALPDRIPTHWDARGRVNGYGGRIMIFLMPGMLALMLLLFRALPWLSHQSFEVDSFQSTYLFIMLMTSVMFAYIHVLHLWALLDPPVRMERALPA